MQKPSTIDIDPVIYLAIELSASTWLVVSKIPTSEKTGLHRMEAGNSQALIALIADLRKKVSAKLGVESAVMSCFEAGRDGFWLHRLLSEHGVINHVVEPTSILVNRRARRAKTDRLDAQGLLRILTAHAKGDHDVCSVVHVPTIEEEDAKRQHREREHLVQERVRIENRIAALLTTQGVRKRPSLRSWQKDMEEMRTGDGHPIPPLLRVEVNRLRRRLVMTLEMIREVEAEREQALQKQDDTASRTIQALSQLRGIGDNFAAVLTRDLSFVREPPANRQLSRPYPNTFPERWDGSRSPDKPGRQCEGAQDAHPARLALAALSARQQPGMLVSRACRKSARAHPPHRHRRHGT
jgi:transposase